MATRLERGNSELDNERLEVPTTARISQDSCEHVLHCSGPSALPASGEDTSSPYIPSSPAETPANEKDLLDQEQMVEGDNKEIYPSAPILVTLTIALMIAIFMIGLDTNIIGESILFKVLLRP